MADDGPYQAALFRDVNNGINLSAPQEPVAAVDHPHAHARGPVLPDFLDVAGQLTALRVVLAAQDVAQLSLLGGLIAGVSPRRTGGR